MIKEHRLENIVKVVSGMDQEALEEIAKVYEMVVEAGVYKAESTKATEAAKVIENAQRAINIAFMNELSIIILYNKLGIDTKAVLEAAATKWNFLKFTPELVGGHCIGVDPYYLTYKAQQMGYHSQIILAGRKINDEMGKYVAENTVKKMIQANRQIKGAKVVIMGITFKENCPDSRNTRVIDIVRELQEYGIQVQVMDPIADASEVKREYGIDLCKLEDISGVDAVVVAVAHDEFKRINLEDLKSLYKRYDNGKNDEALEEIAVTLDENSDDGKLVLTDEKGIFDRKHAEYLNSIHIGGCNMRSDYKEWIRIKYILWLA